MRFFSLFSRGVRMGMAAAMLLTLPACSEIELLSHGIKKIETSPSVGSFKVGKPYRVEGTTYTPRESYSLDETGIASWYGPGFHGRKTASGENFDTGELTAAHRTLQLPSLVRVTNLENGRSLIVRVNDRGPFSKGRIIDVSSKAADLLGFKGRGTAKVRLQVLAEESRQLAEAAKRGIDTRGMEVAFNEGRTPDGLVLASAAPQASAGASFTPPPTVLTDAGTPHAPLMTPSGIQGHVKGSGVFYPDPVVTQMPVAPTSIFVQAGAFANQDNAIRLSQRLEQTVGTARVVPRTVNGQLFYRVQVGPVPDVPAADALLSRVINTGIPEARIVVDSS